MEHVNRNDKGESLDMGLSLESFFALAAKMMREQGRKLLYG